MSGSDNPNCFWNPTLPECQPPAEETSGSEEPEIIYIYERVSDITKQELIDYLQPLNPLRGNLVMLAIAIVNTVLPLIQQRRWRSSELGGSSSGTYYQAWASLNYKVGLTNIWQYSDLWNAYGRSAIWAPLILAQILSTLGINPELAQMVYTNGQLAQQAHFGVYSILLSYCMYKVYTVNMTDGMSANTLAWTAEIIEQIQMDFATYAGAMAFS